MKKLILIICLFAGISAYSQPYQAVLGKDTTQWNYYASFGDNENIFKMFTYRAFGDTIINGLNYKNFLSVDAYTFNAFIREDTVTGRMWVLNNGTEYKIMDLSLETSKKLSNSCIYLEVKSDSIIDNRKVQYLSNNYKSIEGIGNTFLPDNIYRCSNNGSVLTYLLCVYRNGNEVYNNTNETYYDCNLPLTYIIHDKKIESDLPFVVNVNNRTLNILSESEKVKNVEIFSLNGKRLLKKKFSCNSVEIDISKLSLSFNIVVINNLYSYKFKFDME